MTTPSSETNTMTKKSVDVCADRHNFDGGLQKYIKVVFFK